MVVYVLCVICVEIVNFLMNQNDQLRSQLRQKDDQHTGFLLHFSGYVALAKMIQLENKIAQLEQKLEARTAELTGMPFFSP